MTEQDYSGLPESLREGARRYFEHGIQPGSFLTAVIQNDLQEVAQRADTLHRILLVEIVQWVIAHAPSGSWGSPAEMAAWMKAKRTA